ncbi:hypothetical protein HYX19_04260 [Candidatus Woesearchaeota archaeon]|nr:hypothetical protein [Candidatus Woesearchaeota archaeon]
MRALFLVTGVGYGDATREHADIVAFLKKSKKNKVLVAGYDNSYEYFKNKFPTVRISGYKMHERNLKFQILSFLANNYNLPFSWVSSALKLRDKLGRFKPDVIISDFEPTGILLSRLINRKCIIIFGYDPIRFKNYSSKNKVSLKVYFEAKYFESIYNMADKVIIPSLFKDHKKTDKYIYVNPIMREPKKQPNEKILMKKLGLEKKPVIVMLGGSDFGHAIVNELLKVAHEFDEQFIIFGSRFGIIKTRNVEYIPFTNNFYDYLKVSKGVITLAGQLTLTECLFYRKPFIAYPIKDHVEQLLNAESLKNVGIIGTSPRNIKKDIKKMLKDSKRIIKVIKKLNIKINGASQVVDAVYDTIKNG